MGVQRRCSIKTCRWVPPMVSYCRRKGEYVSLVTQCLGYPLILCGQIDRSIVSAGVDWFCSPTCVILLSFCYTYYRFHPMLHWNNTYGQINIRSAIIIQSYPVHFVPPMLHLFIFRHLVVMGVNNFWRHIAFSRNERFVVSAA